MNYSQRKHIERLLMAGAPSEHNDQFGIWPSRLFGINVIESPDRPRYTLPAEVIQGVPWPPGFREEINRWSVEFLGTVNYLPRGTAYVIGSGYAVMRPEDVVKIINLC